MAVRASKVALARAAELLDTDRSGARDYLRCVQARAGAQLPYTKIVAAIEAVGPELEAVTAEAAARAARERE